jgi:hypothetical protein
MKKISVKKDQELTTSISHLSLVKLALFSSGSKARLLSLTSQRVRRISSKTGSHWAQGSTSKSSSVVVVISEEAVIITSAPSRGFTRYL